jgi:ABC-type antimicrobial peptide transport system permease subunit
LAGLILAKGMAVALLGVAFGAAVSYGLGRAVESLLFGVSSSDPMTFAFAAVVLIASAALAAWLPARRAARLDASIALRE